jgi:hypothetical protein
MSPPTRAATARERSLKIEEHKYGSEVAGHRREKSRQVRTPGNFFANGRVFQNRAYFEIDSAGQSTVPA